MKKSIYCKRFVISLFICFLFFVFSCTEENNSPDAIVGSQTFSSIQEAVDFAADGDTIYLQTGTYTGEKNKNISWNGNEKHLTFTTLSGADHEATIDCEGSGSGFFLGNEGHNRDDVIEGITIKNAGDNVSDYDAGIHCFYSHITVKNCKIINCGWAGIFCEHANPLIENSHFINNKVGILVKTFSLPTIQLNILQDSEYEAIMIQQNASAYIINNLIKENERGVSSYDATAYLVNNTIVNNASWGFKVQNGEPVMVANNIIWNNEDDINIYNNFYQISYNCFSDTIAASGGLNVANITLDPQFADIGNDNFQLLSDSPCINNGTLELPSEIEIPETDLGGNPRNIGVSIDMGAYEYQFEE